MRRRPNEREMIVNAKVRLSDFSSGNITGTQMIEALVKALPRMARFVENNEPPFAVKIARDGTLERIDLRHVSRTPTVLAPEGRKEKQMKSGIRGIVGKTVTGVVVKESFRLPRSQVFLLFSDGTYFELYGDISGASGLDRGGIDNVRDYMSSSHEIVLEELLEGPTG